jgi:hypothetical protein
MLVDSIAKIICGKKNKEVSDQCMYFHLCGLDVKHQSNLFSFLLHCSKWEIKVNIPLPPFPLRKTCLELTLLVSRKEQGNSQLKTIHI